MGELKETIEIKQVHDNDKYIVKRVIIEELTEEELSKIANDINDAYTESKKQLDDIPKQVEERTKVLQKQLDTLEERQKTFKKYAKKFNPEKKE